MSEIEGGEALPLHGRAPQHRCGGVEAALKDEAAGKIEAEADFIEGKVALRLWVW